MTTYGFNLSKSKVNTVCPCASSRCPISQDLFFDVTKTLAISPPRFDPSFRAIRKQENPVVLQLFLSSVIKQKEYLTKLIPPKKSKNDH